MNDEDERPDLEFCFQYEQQSAEICLPKLGAPQCESTTVKGVGVTMKEQCLQITRTVCMQDTG